MKNYEDLPDEYWKEIPDTHGRYFVSNKGRIKSVVYVHNNGRNSHYKETIRKICRYVNGYCFVSLSVDGVITQQSIHRLVMGTFCGFSKLEVNHKDGDKNNNSLENLEYISHSDNITHSFRVLKREPVRSWLGKSGFSHNKSHPIILTHISDHSTIVFGSLREAESKGYNRNTLSRCIKRNTLYNKQYKVERYGNPH